MNRSWALLAMSLLVASPVSARVWNPQGKTLAEDYSVISDNRPDKNIVMLMWLTTPMVDNLPTVQALLDKYLIIGASITQIQTTGTLAGDGEMAGPQPVDMDGTQLKPLTGDQIPPAVQAILAGVGGMMRQSFGAMGQNMRFYVFDSGNVRACGKGKLSVPFAGVTYTYDTPIPGCPKP
jgi:hypothetical protein